MDPEPAGRRSHIGDSMPPKGWRRNPIPDADPPYIKEPEIPAIDELLSRVPLDVLLRTIPRLGLSVVESRQLGDALRELKR